MLSADAFLAFFAAEENGRGALLKKAWENFLRSPLFGVGMGYGGGIEGFMGTAWTHNLPMQILGSMGIVGVLAYGYQLVVRAKLVFAKRDAFHMMMGISYLGIFLISMLQPGEFCPMPYEFLAVAIFCVLELYEKREAPYLTLDKTE
jgi:O-antigen ligase